MRTSELTPKALKLVKTYGIEKEDMLCVSPFDLSLDGEYVYGYLLLTKDMLGIVMSKPIQQSVRYFRGTKTEQMEQEDFAKEYVYRGIERSKINEIYIEKMVATNLIYVVLDGIETKLCASTNLYLEQLNELVKFYHQGGEVMNEDQKMVDEEEQFCPVCGTMYPDPKRHVCPKCMNKHSIFMRTFHFFLAYKVKLCVLFLCYIAAALINLAWPYLSGTILFDDVLMKNNAFLDSMGMAGRYTLALFLVVLAMLMAKVVQQGVSILQGSLMAIIVADTVRDMKKKVFASLGRLSINFFTSKQTGGLMTRVLSDAERVTNFFLDGFPFIFVHGFTIIASFVVMFSLNFRMAILACILLPLLVIMSVKLKPKLWSLHGRRHRAERALNSKLNDNLTGVRVVKAFGQQDAENERFDETNERLKDAEIRIVKYNNRFTILYNFVQEVSSIWVWMLGVVLIMKTGDMKLGVLITFAGYVGQLNGPMNFFSRVFHMWSESINSAQRMFEIIDAVADVQEIDEPVVLEQVKGRIDLNHVTFGYDKNHPVLKDIDLHIHDGEMLGIVGRSGAGKTTLVNLISRLYDVDEGEMMLDGVNVKDLSFAQLRRNVAVVSQDTYIFMGTVEENIAYANPEATKEDIIQAAMLASAHEFISRMPDSYDTVIGSSGKDLSGGEKQRISIARAILANPKILILDEATASVDTETERAIQRSLNYLVKGRTTLSIAHRLSTLRDADRLIVIDHGRIVEEGTHDELEQLQGIYAMLVELQTKSLALKGLEM